MKFSFHSGSFHDLPIIEVIKKIKDYGYDAIELNGEHLPWIENEKDIHVRPDMSDQEVEDIKNALNESDLNLSALSAHIGLIENNSLKREEVISHSKNLILLGKKLGTDVVHGLSGFKPDNLSDEEAWELLIENVEEIVQFAEKENIKYAFEPVVGMFINSGEKLKKLQERISTGTLYVNFDPSHLILVNDDINQLVRDFNKDIVNVHYKDGKGITEDFEFPPLGQGEVDLDGFVQVLKDVGYVGYLSIEYEANYFGGYSDDIDQAAQDSLEMMKKHE